jgi:thiosulfate reductase cytochrome b subunit
MWPHYWLGYALVGLVLVHTKFVGPAMGRSEATGIWAATLALCLLFAQVGIGLNLKSASGPIHRLRQWHFWTMIALIAMVLIHLLRNA